MSTYEVEFQRNRIEEIFDYGLDTEHFTIYLHGVEDNVYTDIEDVGEPGVEFRLSNRFIKGMDVLSGMDSNAAITVSMKTCGGDWHEGMAIYDSIRAVPNPVIVVSYTHARSMSSIILQAANKRVLMPHSYFLFHQGTNAVDGTVKQVRAAMKFDEIAGEQMLDIYVDRMKEQGNAQRWGRKRIRDWLTRSMERVEDVYFTPEETVAWGLADEIFTDWGSVTDLTPEQRDSK